jgi:hypothetical protein
MRSKPSLPTSLVWFFGNYLDKTGPIISILLPDQAGLKKSVSLFYMKCWKRNFVCPSTSYSAFNYNALTHLRPNSAYCCGKKTGVGTLATFILLKKVTRRWCALFLTAQKYGLFLTFGTAD